MGNKRNIKKKKEVTTKSATLRFAPLALLGFRRQSIFFCKHRLTGPILLIYIKELKNKYLGQYLCVNRKMTGELSFFYTYVYTHIIMAIQE